MALSSNRWWLSVEANIWRFLMKIGMFIHRHATPRAPSPSFSIKIPSRISSKPGEFKLVFYVPEGYDSALGEQKYPVVVNYHGGGFVLGTGTDDCRWAKSVVENTKAVLVSVEYRLAPEYPFSVGVEDSTDAVLYLVAHANELRIDPHQIALSGFSAGGMLVFTVPLMLHDLQVGAGKRSLKAKDDPTPKSHMASNSRGTSAVKDASIKPNPPSGTSSKSPTSMSPEPQPQPQIPPLTIQALISFYPATDYRIPRPSKQTSTPNPTPTIPHALLNLFDPSYIDPSHTTVPLTLSDPYLSPAAASDSLLSAAYPNAIALYTCEHDILKAEGVAFADRLRAEPIAKRRVTGGVVQGVAHAFDKMPMVGHVSEVMDRMYAEACGELNAVFVGGGGRGWISLCREIRFLAC